MDVFQIKSNLIDQLIKISKEAGQAILEVYKTNFDYQIKEDLSPLTKADTLSNNIICEGLKVITPNIPILSEENSNIPFNIRSLWKQYWLVDPLDGTKEFINKNGEFTVNIALIRDHRPVFGLIHLPVKKYTFWGCEHKGSFFLDKKNNAKKIKVSKNMNDPIRIAASRSHPSDKLTNLLNKIENYKLLKVGSSLKFCLIASGEADIYPRFGPTCEWDTAAGEAIAKFAGATVVDLNNKDLNYNSKNSYINPPFLSTSSKKLALELIKKIQNK
tara:strand:- start:134 stop:952 length:819 start_codon:yes stop_codon:yes gene_type:complete